MEEEPDEQRGEKCDDLIARDTARVDADAGIHGTHKQQSQVSAYHFAGVHVANARNRNHIGSVKSRAMQIRMRVERNFPATTARSVTARVSSSSMVPVFRSSASRRILSAGIKKKSVQ